MNNAWLQHDRINGNVVALLFSHLFTQGKYFAFDTNSGAPHQCLQTKVTDTIGYDAVGISESELVIKTDFGVKVPVLNGNQLILHGTTDMVAGYMPRGYQCGFIYEQATAHTIAHELGHGAYYLSHTFNPADHANYLGNSGNLMDYSGHNSLVFKQWDKIPCFRHALPRIAINPVVD